MFKYFIYVFSVLVFIEGIERWHTSQKGLMKLYDLQKEHFVVFKDYLDLELKRLEELKKTLTAAYEWHNYTVLNKVTFLNNHINAILTINRINRQMCKIRDLTTNKESTEKVLSNIDKHKDLSGDHILLSFRGLRRLQQFYEIPASNMANGKYGDRIIGDQLDSCECYIISKYCFEVYDMFGATDWAIQTYKKWINEEQPKCVDIEVMSFLLTSSSTATGFDLGNLLHSEISFQYNNSKRIKKFTQHFALMSNEILYPDENKTLDIFTTYNTLENRPNDIKFRNLCIQGESKQTPPKHFVCRYQTKNSSYRILMPFKEEDIYSDPVVKIYHDVLYDNEIETIKTLSWNSLADAKVLNLDGTGLLNERTRSGQVGRIFDPEAKGKLDLLNARIECFTGRSTKTAEAYQIVNYGLGGHYKAHSDAFIKENMDKKHGNRLLTVLFYMSDVWYDGSTVFPNIKIISPARKGSALVWYNVHVNNGSIHSGSIHGSCPILKGNKWIMTRWLMESEQDLPYDWRNNIS